MFDCTPPSAFIDQRGAPHIVDVSLGRLDRRAYELRSALRAGRVWVPASRRHADPASYLLPAEPSSAERSTACSGRSMVTSLGPLPLGRAGGAAHAAE